MIRTAKQVFGDFSFFFTWAFATEYSLFRKLVLLVGTVSPQKNDWLTDGSCRHILHGHSLLYVTFSLFLKVLEHVV